VARFPLLAVWHHAARHLVSIQLPIAPRADLKHGQPPYLINPFFQQIAALPMYPKLML
jgi:hypothetical protein